MVNVIDNVMRHGRSVSQLPLSTYRLNFETANPAYPLGAFMLPGLGHALTGIDVAWVFQPYLACCAAAVSLCLYALMKPLIASPRLRSLFAFLGAQASLLYAYSLWGGVKELTAAFLLALGAALGAVLLRERPPSWRALIPLALAAGGLIQTLGVGAAGWIVAALVALAAGWLWRRRGAGERTAGLVSIGWAAGLTAAAVIPLWVVLSDFFSGQGDLIHQLFSSGASAHTKLGNLYGPLSIFQLAGIWPVGDFRLTAPTIPSALWIGLTLLAAAGALFVSIRRRRSGIPFYVGVALVGMRRRVPVGRHPMGCREGDGAVLAGAPDRGAGGRRAAVHVAAGGRDAGDPRAGRRGAVVQRARLPRRDARAPGRPRRAPAHRRARRRQGPDLHQRVRSLCRPPFPS